MVEPWADAPLTDPNKDKLDRGPFVKMVANLIEGLADSNDSTVLGLVGAWGSGKSTVLHYITRRLDRTIKVVRFNPWSFEDDESLQAGLYSAILEAVPIGSHESVQKKAIEVLRRGAPALKAIPVVGNAAAETLREFLPSKSWDSAFSDLATAIRGASVKILVVVDDVDRLQPKELLLLMKTVRLLGRFPRVNYLLAYDRKSTIRTLRTALGSDTAGAEDYLEKIVQYPLDLPAPQQQFLQEIVFGALGPSLDNASANRSGATPRIRFDSFYRDHMWTSLTTPRACQRFALQARTFLPPAGGDVDPADFYALTFLRLFFADLYNMLPIWADDLTIVRESSEMATVLKAEKWVERIVACGYEKDIAHELVEALSSIFPQAFARDAAGSSGANRDCRAYDREYFKRYFTFSLPAGDVSDVLVRRDLDRVLSGEVHLGGSCPETFDHPVEDTQMRALRKGTRQTDYEAELRPLIHYLSRGLAQRPVILDRYIGSFDLKVIWVAKLIHRQGAWDPADVHAVVSRFHRPAALGSILTQTRSLSREQDRLAAAHSPHGEDQSVFVTASFADALVSSWLEQATTWLVDQWCSKSSDVPDAERLDVWSSVFSLDGMDQLQKLTTDALVSGRLSLAALASKFVVPLQLLDNHRAPESELALDMHKLEDTVPEDLLLTLILDDTARPGETNDHSQEATTRRTKLGIEGLVTWRAERAEQPKVAHT